VLYAGLLQWPARLQASAGVAGSALMLALLPWTGLSIGPNPLGAYQQFWLALACPIIAWMLLNLPGNLREEHSAPA
jgi:hypothetical protein